MACEASVATTSTIGRHLGRGGDRSSGRSRGSFGNGRGRSHSLAGGRTVPVLSWVAQALADSNTAVALFLNNLEHVLGEVVCSLLVNVVFDGQELIRGNVVGLEVFIEVVLRILDK